MIDALAHATGYEYDAAGNLRFFTDAKGPRHRVPVR
jgi:YD repeat-containing protein